MVPGLHQHVVDSTALHTANCSNPVSEQHESLQQKVLHAGPILKTAPINKDWFPGDKPVLTKIEDLGGVKVSTVGLQSDWFAKRPTDVKVWRKCRFGTGIGLLGQKKFPKYICNNCGPGYFELCNVNNDPSLLEVPLFFFRRGVKLNEACIEFSGVVDPAQPKSFVTNALLY